MNTKEMIEKISEKDFEVDEFVHLALTYQQARDEIVNQMVSHAHIMVYYHCYYVISKASQEEPHLFYEYWDQIAGLLKHKNSYHRDFAIVIIGNLTEVDHENRFSEIEGDYFACLNDEKFMTGNCCLQNLVKIYRHKEELRQKIFDLLLDIDQQCDYTQKQKGLLKFDVLEIFDEIYAGVQEKELINEFIRREVNCISPKTRKKAKELTKKYSL